MNEKFVGFLDYHTSFELDSIPEQTLLDLGRVHDMAEVWVNGKPIGKRLWLPYRFDLSGKIKKAGQAHFHKIPSMRTASSCKEAAG